MASEVKAEQEGQMRVKSPFFKFEVWREDLGSEGGFGVTH
jgi:hypothetical protein